jgi:probable F420-dependent oxidoreductase
MPIGLVYPQTEYPTDPAAVREYAQTAEGLGYSHILAYDHVLGANPDRPGGWQGPYTYRHPFQEPLVLFSFMAGITSRIGFTTGVIILPQRQTALAAKQAASLDVLSGGRLRFGVGLGWNQVEYEGLNEDFHTRGRRIEEQVELLRRLWTEPLVTFKGRWHSLSDAGINPLPVQRSIPIWFGGRAEPALRRAARLGDGWLSNNRSPDEARPALDALSRSLAEAGRAGAAFGIEARLAYGSSDTDGLRRLVEDWTSAGATHFSLNTMGCGFSSAREHLQAVEKFALQVGVG